jgi:hypothetical protein
MASGFAQASAVGIRRHVKYKEYRKSDEDSVSLLRFLTEVKNHPDLITRQYYLDLYKAQNAYIEIGEKDFDNVAGVGNDRLPKARIVEHINELKGSARKVEKYVDKRVAHYDQKPPVIPTFGELKAALATMEKLTMLYLRLLQGPIYDQLLPIMQFDWKSIFYFAWLEPTRFDRTAFRQK